MSKAPIRVLHCVGSMDRGGAETWLMRVLRNVDRSNFRLDFCCLSGRAGAYASEIKALGMEVHLCPLSRNLWDFNQRFRTILTQGQYDVVHSHVHYFSGYILRQAKIGGVPGRIAHSHNSSDGRSLSFSRLVYRKWMQTWIQRYANAGIAVAQETAVSLFGPTWQDDSRWSIVRCGIDLAPFMKTTDRTQVLATLGLPLDSLVIGHIGRFNEQKNHNFLVSLASDLVRTHPAAVFLLIGDGPLRPSIEQKIRNAGIESNFYLAGVRDDVPDLLSTMDVFVMPSLYEGLPVAGLEAQAAGIPCLFSDRITQETAIIHETVRFLPLDAPISIWTHTLLELAGAKRVDAATRAEAFDRTGFSIERSARQLCEMYLETSSIREVENAK